MEYTFSSSKLPLPLGIRSLDFLINKTPVVNLTLEKESSGILKLAKQVSGIQAFHDEQNAARYLIRKADTKFNYLYPKDDVHKSVEVDEWIVALKNVTYRASITPNEYLGLAKKIEETLKDSGRSVLCANGSDKLSLADYLLWSFFKSYQLVKTGAPNSSMFPHFESWLEKVGSTEECKAALEDVKKLLPYNQTPSAAVNNAEGFKNVVEDPFNYIKKRIASEVAPVLGFSVEEIERSLEISKSNKFVFTIPLPRLRVKNIPEFAEKVLPNIKESDILSGAEIENTVIGFKVPFSKIVDLTIPSVYSNLTEYGKNDSLAGQFVVCEFSSPNIAKPFHAGHLRGTIHGNFVKNVCKANGMKVHCINYLGDWGKQYGLLAVGFQKFGSEEELQKNPIQHLFDVYVRINKEMESNPSLDDEARAYFKKMEDGDKEALAMWAKFRNLSIVKYKETYKRLNIEFDEYSGESQFCDAMIEMCEHLKKQNLLKEDNGAMIVDLKEYKLIPAVIQKTDGATLYITRDLAAAYERYKKYNFDTMYYVVGAQQDLHFKQMFKILELAGFDWAKKCQHINFGLVKGMSTRKGTVKFLDDILEEAKKVMHEVMKKTPEKYKNVEDPETTADILGISAVVVQDMGARRIKDYQFSWERMTSFEGDTGPLLQYSHARLCSIERKYLNSIGISPSSIDKPPFVLRPETLSCLDHPKCKDVVFTVSQYPDIIRSLPSGNFEACKLLTYLIALARKISSCLDDVYVIGQDRDVAEGRFWMYWSARVVMGNGIRMLGLTPLERM